MRKFGFIFSVLIVGLFASCSKDTSTTNQDLYTPTASDATATATLADLQQGKALYMANCGSCHGLYSPDAHSASNWTGIISNMAQKTQLTSSEVTLISKYLKRGK